MTAILRNEASRLLRGSLVLTGVFTLLAAMYYPIFPGFAADAEELEAAFPPELMDFFGIEALDTIEGFIAAEMYSFFWVLLIGIYFAYISAGTIAGDVERRKMDLTLSNPVSRESVLVQKVLALGVPLIVLNIGVIVINVVGSRLIDEPLSLTPLLMVHLLSIPYLLVCAGIGLVMSVVMDRARSAQGIALILVFTLWLIDSASRLDADYEWIGYLTPSRYYDETAILVREEFAYFDAAVLTAGFLVLLLLSTALFLRRDI